MVVWAHLHPSLSTRHPLTLRQMAHMTSTVRKQSDECCRQMLCSISLLTQLGVLARE